MLKKTLALLLTVAMLSILPVLAGCEKPSTYHTHSENTTETDRETHTVVE